MVEITEKPISPEWIIQKVKNDDSGCVVTYTGLIREHSQGKPVLSVEYQDSMGNAESTLQEITTETKYRWQIEKIAISHRIGKLKVGEINLVIAVASAHRGEGFAACQYAIEQFKLRLPTKKTETYHNSSMRTDKV